MSIQVNLIAEIHEERENLVRSMFRSLCRLAVDPKTWSSLALFGVVWRLAVHWRVHRRVVRLRSTPVYGEHLQRDPRFLFKYLSHDYLARSMTVPERAACFLHHYRHLYREFPDGVLIGILSGEASLLTLPEADGICSITMGLSKPWDKEGELSLNLRVRGQLAYVLSFSIVPGWVVGSEATDVLMIARLQGERGGRELVAQASKAMRDVAPAPLLVAALEGLAEALGIPVAVSVRAEDQTSYRAFFDFDFRTAYDGFFSALGLSLNDAGFYETTLPLAEKPLAAVKRGHKLRTKAKRELKRRIAKEIGAAVNALRRRRLLMFKPSADGPERAASDVRSGQKI